MVGSPFKRARREESVIVGGLKPAVHAQSGVDISTVAVSADSSSPISLLPAALVPLSIIQSAVRKVSECARGARMSGFGKLGVGVQECLAVGWCGSLLGAGRVQCKISSC